MRTPCFLAGIIAVLGISASASAQEAVQTPKDAPKREDATAPYPTEVALLRDPSGSWTYRQSPDRLPLYMSDKDKPGVSTCYEGCDTEWIALLAKPDAKPLGKWSLVTRKGGKRQWAYNKRPVYMLVHDSPEAPIGDGTDGHHLMPRFQ